MEPEFIPVFHDPKHTYLKILSPHLPIYYFLQNQSEQHSIIIINHPKAQLKTATIQTNQNKIMDIDNSKETEIISSCTSIPDKREINLVSILIKEISMKLDITTHNENTLLSLKQKIILELESFCTEKISDIISTSDLKFFLKNLEIIEVTDNITLENFVIQHKLSQAFLGNILYLDVRILDQIKAYQLITRLYIDKMIGSSKLMTLVKFQKINKKLASRILLIKETEEELVSVIVQELNNNKTSNFPLNAIKFVERLDENAPELEEELKQFKNAVPVRFKFHEKLEWESMFLIFLYEESYLKFLVNYLETKKVDPNEEDEEGLVDFEEEINRKQKSYSINFHKNTNMTESDTQKVSKFLRIKELGKELKERTESMSLKKNRIPLNKSKSPISNKNSRNSIILENELKNLIIINSTVENTGEDNAHSINSPMNSTSNKKKTLEKDLTKDEIIKYEKNFDILAQGGIFSGVSWKNEKTIKFSCESLEIQISNLRTKKFICSYMLSDLNIITTDDECQITLNFKKQRKLKNLSLIFSKSEDLNEFMETYQILSKRQKKSKNTDLEIKDFLKKNLRRYSWLSQPLTAIIPKKSSAEYSFQIINEDFSPAKQILHLNFIHKIISFLKKDKEKASILKEFNIQKIIHLQNNFQDSRKITLKLEKKKSINILFSNVQNKLVFESAVNPILHESFLQDYNNLHSIAQKIYVTTWNVGFSEPPDDIARNKINFLAGFDEHLMVIIGLQECKANSWIDCFQNKLKSKFSLISVMTMWRMTLCVFIKKEWINFVKNIEVNSKPTGIGKILGNKGGVMISFTIFETSFCFISCHLAAKPNHEVQRRENYHDLIKSLRNGLKTLEPTFQFDYFFCLGDMNFRINGPFDLVLEMVNNHEFPKLKEFCQLEKARNNNLIFSDLEEADINFKPTYRRIRHDSGYSNKKNQAPSWCDRIFYRKLPNHNLKVLEYDSKESQLGSDHKPVYGVYEVEIHLPFNPLAPLYMRGKIFEGVIKFHEIEIDYYYKMFTIMNDNFNLPCEISFNFYAPFLVNNPSSTPILIENEEGFKKLTWNEDMIPLIFLSISDHEYLEGKNLTLVMAANPYEKDNETMLGQISIPLNILFDEKKGVFQGRVSLYGRVFGLIKCKMEFYRNEEETEYAKAN